ncbi:uncharacterized protein [Watersipora subatra]|uniref:uncharacterized protein n=1 Tax=Watersipora subatra TaxID=2589382 RepID=UPI00355C0E92
METEFDRKKSLHLRSTPKQNLSLQREVDDVAMRSIREISLAKAVKFQEDQDDVEKMKCALEPNFVPVRRFEHRKSKPVYHEPGTARPQSPRPPPSKVANVPGYNQLDKPIANPLLMSKTKKFPYSKSDKVTTEEMKKVKKSSMGVLPSSRLTTELNGLNVLMEGQLPKPAGYDLHINMVEDANIQGNSQSVDYSEFRMFAPMPPSEKETKPAILAQTGTTHGIKMSERTLQPQAKKPSVDLELVKKRAAARERKLRQEQKNRQLEEQVRQLNASAADDRLSSDASSTSLRSVQELLEEAESIAAGAVPGGKTRKTRRHKQAQVSPPEKTVRNVDEIIASLKTQTTQGEKESDADRQIREIMGRVMKHATAVLGDIDNKPESQTSLDKPGEGTASPAPEETINTKPDEASQAPSPVPPVISLPPEANSLEGITDTQDGGAVCSSSEHSRRTSASTFSVQQQQDKQEEGSMADDKGYEEKATPDLFDLRTAYQDLIIAPQVTHADIVSVHGQVKTFVSKLLDDGRTKKEVTKHLANVHDSVRSYVSKYKTTDADPKVREPVPRQPNYYRNVHYCCTAKHGVQMPAEMARAVRMYHTPDMMKKALKNSWALNEHHLYTNKTGSDHSFQVSEEPDIVSDASLARKRSAAARAILDEASSVDGIDYHDWKNKAQMLFQSDKETISVTGTKTGIPSDESRTFWNTAPAKMSMRPAHVREHLFPEYYGAVTEEDGVGTDLMLDAEDTFSDAEEQRGSSVNSEERHHVERVLLRRYHSAQDLTHLLRVQMQESEEPQLIHKSYKEREAQVSEVDEREDDELLVSPSKDVSTATGSPSKFSSSESPVFHYTKESPKRTVSREGPLTDDQIFPAQVPRRSESAPSLIELNDDFVAIPENYASTMGELERQRRQIKEMKVNKANRELQTLSIDLATPDEPEVYFLTNEQVKEKRKELVRWKIDSEEPTINTVTTKPSLAEQALAAGRNYVILPKKKPRGAKAKRAVDFSRIEDIEAFLHSSPNKLKRSTSIYNMRKVLPERGLRVPQHVRDRRRGSIPDLLDWREYTTKHDMTENANQREFARDIWNIWFDETFPPEQPKSEHEEEVSDNEEEDETDAAGERISRESGNSSGKKDKKSSAKSEGGVISDEEFLRIESLEPLSDETEEEMMLREALEEEATKVKDRIAARALPFDYCRLGAIQRKLGQLKAARENLDKALSLEDSLVHGYWQRHLLFLLQGKKTEALEDLNRILKVNRSHAGAYISRAELMAQSDPTMAVTNLTQAIKIQPTNADIYMRRAKLYQGRDQVLLAMEDYAKAYKLNPKLTNAIFSRAEYYFNQGNWQAAINDFTEFLRKCPFDANARLLRGQAFTKQFNYQVNPILRLQIIQKAVQDLSAAIHLDPNNWQAFFHRACIFRKMMPKQSLLDYSMSILINDSEENIRSLLHRGVLYDAMNQPEDAIADFEAILKLRKDVAVGHLNLGLIYLTKMDSYQKAIRKFTSAIKCDPTFVRAYICRAEAYTKIHDHKNALLDYTRAIHLRPEVPDYYMHRGMMLLKSGNTELAAFCVRHVSELFADLDLGQSATQQAVVHGFLKNYSKAVYALENALKVTPNAPLFVLLGKTQMKAKSWNDAIDSFTKALQALKPWKPKDKWPKEGAEVNYLVGLCSLELRNYLQAHDAFNNAIEIDKKYALAYYQRGVAKLRLKQHKGLQDINRALAIDRTIFQAYLTRAAYYGVRKQYSKAILNCNEAIKLKPLSVRGYLYRGALKYHIRAYELAMKDLTKATKIDNQCALAYFNRAVCYHDSGQYEKALTDYGIVLLLGDQLMLKVLINRGLLYLSHGDYKNALHDFLLAAKVNSNDPKIRHTLGLCMHKLRQLKEAVAIFSEALAIDKFFMEAYVSRGNAFLDYANEAGVKAAQADYERALMLKPTYLPARINLAYSLQMSGKFQQSWTQFTIAIDQDSKCQAAYEGRAIVNLQMSNLFAALQDVNASIKIKASAELYTNRGVISLFMKDATGAMHDFQAAIKLNTSYSLAYFNAANIYFKNKQFRQALSYYDRAIQFNTRDESALANRAITKAVIKDFSGAFSDFAQALLISPKSAYIYFNRGNLHFTKGDWKKAEENYSQALTLQPDDPLMHKRRADALGKLGQKEKAVQDYQYAIQLQARIRFLKSINTR